MTGKLRNMTSVYLLKDDKVLLLFRKGGRVVSNVWIGSAGGHFEEFELNDAKAYEEVSDDLVSNEGELKWFSLNKLDELEMPYTARYVMDHYCLVGQ